MNKKFAPLIIVLLLAAAGVAFFTTTRKTSSAGLHISGNIEATTVNVSFRIPGRLKARLVDEGMTVTFGQPVATLDTEDIDQEVAQRASDAAAARAALAELQAGSRKEEIRRAEAVLVRAEAEALRLEREYTRAKALFGTEVLSRQQMEAAEAAATASRAAAREAGESLALARKGARPEQLDAARARLQSAEAVLAAVRLKRGYAEVQSPINGVVLAKHAEPGEQLAAGAPVVTVADLKNVWLRAYIPETELGQVKIGTPAVVTTDSYPGKKYPGKVTFISSEAEFTPRTVQTEKERVKLVYRIKISLDNPDQELKPGMPADGVLARMR